MRKQRISEILMSGLFLVSVVIGANVMAQAVPFRSEPRWLRQPGAAVAASAGILTGVSAPHLPHLER
jgi:hypothetical protein